MKIKNSDAVVKFFIDLSNKNAIKGVTELDKKSTALSKKFSQAGKALTIGLTAPIVAFGTYAVKTATDFDRASNQIQAGLGLSTDKAKEFDNVLREMYTANYGESYEDLANKISYVAQATGEVDPSKIKGLTENAIALEETFGSDFNETIRGVTNLMTHFGISSEEAFDLFAKGSQLGLDYTDELGDNIAEYGGNFKQAGYSATEYFQLLSNGTKNGAYNLDKVNDSINEIKNRLGDGTIKDSLSIFSSETKTVFKNWENGEGTMKDVINSIVSDISNCENEQKQLTMAATAFGTMGEDANLKVVTSLTTVGNEFNNVKGSMESLKEVKYDDLGSMIESLGRQFSDIALDIGNELMPTIQSGIENISKLVNWFSDLDDNGKKIVLTIAGIAIAIGPLSAVIGKLITIGTGISKITQAFKKWEIATKLQTIATNSMATAQKLLNTVMNMNPIALITASIVALISILVLCYNKFEWFRDGVNAIAQGIADFFVNAWNLIGSTASNIWNSILDLFSQGGRIFTGIVDGIAGVFKTIVNALIKGINKLIRVPFDTINGILNFIRNISILGVSPFKGLWKQNPLPIPQIPTLDVGTNYVDSEGLAYLHEGEAVVPKKYNPAIGGYGNNYQPNITVIADVQMDKFGQVFVNQVKTFSNGSKGSYNYGGGIK